MHDNRARQFSALSLWLGALLGCGGGGNSPNQVTTTTPPPSPSSQNSLTLTVHPSEQFQTFEAWRATATGPYLLTPAAGTSQLMSPVLLNQILDDLAFDLGLNGLRIEQHSAARIELSNDNADPFVIDWAAFDLAQPYQRLGEPLTDLVLRMQQVVLPLKTRVEGRGERSYTYVSPIYGYGDFPSHWHDEQEYAEFAEAWVTWSRNMFNYVPDYWVIVNEPESAFFTTLELQRDIVAVGDRFRHRGFPTRIQTVETALPGPGELQGVLANASAVPYISLLSFHGYDYGSLPSPAGRNAIRDIGRQFNLRTGMTEICCKGGWDGSYNQALGWARDIYWNLTEADASVWEPLDVITACGSQGCSAAGQDPIMVDADLTRYFKFPAYYGWRQFARYIRPGYRRVGVQCSGCSSNDTVGQNIKPVAFQTSSGGIVVVVINDQSVSQEIALAGLPAGTYEITGVDPGSLTGRTYPKQTISPSQSLSFTFPAQAIVTFVRR